MKPIIALTTNIDNSTISVIRVSGENVVNITNLLSVKKLTKTRHVIDLSINNKFLDNVVLNIYKQPHSFTGEDVVEIMCHANKYIVEEIINFFLNNGCSLAKKGEFLERAYLNNKLRFEKAQLINEMIKAKNEGVFKLYQENYKNDSFYKHIEKTRDDFAKIIMRSDVDVEYPEYENSNQHITNLQNIKRVKTKIQKQLEQIKKIQKLNKGIKVAIIGKVNSGKSTLFNTLLNKKRAIVTNTPGTTTDYIEDWFVLENNIKITLIDTAGLRKTSRQIERKGVEKSIDVIDSADIIINLKSYNDTDKTFISYETNQINVISKIDRVKNIKKNNNIIYISSLNNIGISQLLEKINQITSTLQKDVEKGSVAFVSNINNFTEQLSLINEIINGLNNNESIDIFRFQMERILQLLNTLLGQSEDYDYVKEIFRTFCIGK